MKNKQNGFIGVAVAIIIALILGGGGTYYYKKSKEVKEESNTTENVLEDNTANNQNNLNADIQTTNSSTSVSSDWKTYTNEKLGIQFMYPVGFVLNTTANNYWKNANLGSRGEDYSYRFFELVDSGRGCYIGYLREVDFGNTNIIVKHIEFPKENFTLSLSLASLSHPLIESDYKNSAFGIIVDAGCVKDYEKIISTIKFTK